MVKFGKEFRKGKIEKWKDYYIDYKGLKHFIKVQSNSEALLPGSQEGEKQLGKEELIRKFTESLDKDMKKVYMQYVKIERELYLELNKRIHNKRDFNKLNAQGIDEEINEVGLVAENAYRLTTFLTYNIQAIAKILKKFDKKFKNFNTNLSGEYIVKKLQQKNSDLLYIFQFKIIDESLVIVEEMASQLKYFYDNLKTSPKVVVSEGNNMQENLIQGAEDTEPLSVNKPFKNNTDPAAKYEYIIEVTKGIEGMYSILKNLFNKWNRTLKFEEYFNEKSKSSKSIETKSQLEETKMSSSNKRNIYITLIQRLYMALCTTYIIPNLYSMIVDDFEKRAAFCCFVLMATPVGGLFSILITKFWITRSYKMPMVVSAVLSMIGNFMYVTGIWYDSIILLAVSRLFIGFALNPRVHRRYITDYIPRKQVGKYLLYFKLSFLLGIAFGPVLTLIMQLIFRNSNIKERINYYTTPSFFCCFFAVIILLIVCFGYEEPVSVNFQPYKEGANPEQAISRSNSFVLDSEITNKENDALQQLNEKLSKFNDESQYSDTNLVSNEVEAIVYRERSLRGSVFGAFVLIMILLFIASGILMSIYCCVPLIIDEIFDNMETFEQLTIDKYNALAIGSGLLMTVPIYFMNYFFVSQKLDKIIYSCVLGLCLVILEVFGFIAIFFDMWQAVILDTVLVLIFLHLFLDQVIYFFTKIIPSDFVVCRITPGTFVQLVCSLGEVVGGTIGLFSLLEPETDKYRFKNVTQFMFIFEATILVCVLLLFLSNFENMKEGAVRRIIRLKSTRKMRRTEF